MQIECILKREGGTKPEIGGTEYHFAPNDDGAHVADVTDTAHIQRFLSITEGYRIYGEPVVTPSHGSNAPAITLMGSSVHVASYEIGGKTYQLDEIVRGALENSGLTEEEWNGLAEEDRHARIDMALDDLAEQAEKAAEADKVAAKKPTTKKK